MMPAFLIPLLLKGLTNKYVWIGLGVAAAFVAFLFYRSSLIHEGEAKIQAAMQAAAQAEKDRQASVNQFWRSWAEGAVQNADQQKAQTDELQSELAAATSGNDDPCLDAATVDRLRAIGRPRSTPSSAAGPVRRHH